MNRRQALADIELALRFLETVKNPAHIAKAIPSLAEHRPLVMQAWLEGRMPTKDGRPSVVRFTVPQVQEEIQQLFKKLGAPGWSPEEGR